MRDETNSVRALTEGEEGESTDRLSLLFVLRRAGWLLARVCINFTLVFHVRMFLSFFYLPFSRFFFKLKTRYFGKKKGEDISLLFSRKDFFVRFVSFFFFFNDSKRCYCSIVVIFHRLPCSVQDIFTKHFGFMKWDTKAFRSMGLVHVYTR